MRRMDWRHFLPIKVNISEILQFLFFLAQLGAKTSDFKEKTSYDNGDVCRRYKSSVKSSIMTKRHHATSLTLLWS